MIRSPAESIEIGGSKQQCSSPIRMVFVLKAPTTVRSAANAMTTGGNMYRLIRARTRLQPTRLAGECVR